jgi:hypothetical protein
MSFLIMKLHKAIIVPASVQLVMRQHLCIPHLPMLKCYNSTALNWYQTLSEWHYQMSARKPRQL